jgi:hypothetical protein
MVITQQPLMAEKKLAQIWILQLVAMLILPHTRN